MPATICHLNLARGFRGGERQTELLIRGLAARGVRQMLVARTGQPLVDRLAGTDGLSISPAAGNALAALRHGSGASLLHAHEAHGAHSAFLRHGFSRQPYVLTRRVSNLPGGDFFTRRVYRNAAVVACVAASVARVLEAYDSGIDTAVIHSALSELKADPTTVAELRSRYAGKFLVGHVGALDNKTKGQVYIIRAARKIRELYPDIHFLLIGGGSDEAWLKQEASDLDNLSFTGFVNDVGSYLSVLDSFILPSNIEGIGGILLDAMQFGLPVVASRVGGLGEIVEDGENGILIRPRSPGNLVEAIGRLYNSAGLRAAMGRKGAQFVSGFTPDKMADRYLKLYERVIGGSLT